jgi:Flp pilus assembly protein TadG
MRAARGWLRVWLGARRGNVAIMFALMLPLVVGGAAFGVETTIWYLARLKLQDQADAAAYAGVLDKKNGGAATAITAAATKGATLNGFVTAAGSITVNSPPVSGPSGANAVEVILTASQPRYFTALFTSTPLALRARAVASYTLTGAACILALDPSASGAAHFSGSSSLTLNGCSVMADSTSSTAVSMQGAAAQLNVACIYAVGGSSLNSHATLGCGTAVSGAAPVADPFASLPEPSDPSACKTVGAATLDPGNYCSGFSLNGGAVTLNPGTYIVSGGAFKLNGNVTLTGSGVTFYIKNGVSITMNGNSTVDLSAPTSGPYAGMLFFGERSNTASQTFNGNNTSHLTGNLYFAGGTVGYSGSYAGQNGCTQIVADKVDWTGNSSFSINCSSYGMSPIPAVTVAKLAE